MDQINLYAIATDTILVPTKEYIENKYNNVVMYGTTNATLFADDIFSSVGNKIYQAIIIIDSPAYNDAQITHIFETIRDVTSYVDQHIRIYFVCNDDARSKIPHEILNESNVNYYEIDSEFSTKLLEEGILFTILREVGVTDNAESPVRNRATHPISTGLSSQMPRVVTIEPKSDIDKDTRHICLVESIENMILSSTSSKKDFTEDILDKIMSGDIDNAISKATEDNVNKTIDTSLEELTSEIKKLEQLLEDDPNSEDIKIQINKVQQYRKNITLNKDRYNYRVYVDLLNQASELVANKYTSLLEDVEKETSNLQPILNIDNAKQKIESLKRLKNDLTEKLDNYTQSINLVFNGLTTSYNDSVLYIRDKLKEVNSDVGLLAADSANSMIIKNKLAIANDLGNQVMNIKALDKISRENLVQLLVHTDRINQGLSQINQVLEVIVSEQGELIKTMETQKTVKSIKADDKLQEKVIGITGVYGTGRTAVCLNSAYSLSSKYSLRVTVIDLSAINPQCKFYVENEPFGHKLIDILQQDENNIRNILSKSNFNVVYSDDLPLLELAMNTTYDEIVNRVVHILNVLYKIRDYIFIILPEEFDQFSSITKYIGRLAIVADMNPSNHNRTALLAESIFTSEEVYSSILVKYFIINKATQNTATTDKLLSKCNIVPSEYKILTTPFSENIDSSKTCGRLLGKDSSISQDLFDIWGGDLVDLE